MNKIIEALETAVIALCMLNLSLMALCISLYLLYCVGFFN